MIAERETTRTVTSTIEGEVVKMGIDENAMAHIMNVLTDLYANPELAIVREYSTNALDAHIEAGVTRPIEVTTPSPFSPFLRIKDHGVGLSAEDIRVIYSQYGNSTKRSTNDQVGMLGLGCKSALTYTDNFVVVSVKDGIRIEVSVERDEDGRGVMKRPEATDTTEPNGTEVIIPAKAANKIDAVARQFFSFWEPGTVVLNGAEPHRIEGLDLYDDGRYLVIDGNTDYVVMGNVPYPVSQEYGEPLKIDHGLPNNWNNRRAVAAFVGIGDVNFPPSRESLMGTAKTKATISRIAADVRNGVDKAVQRAIEEAPSPPEAVRVYLKYASLLGRQGASSATRAAARFTYKGLTLPASFTPHKQFPITPRGRWATNTSAGMLVTENSSDRLSRASDVSSYPIQNWETALFLYGYDAMAVTPSQKRKMRKYVEDNKIENVRDFVLIAEYPDADQAKWLGADRIKPWADVKAVVLPKSVAAATTTYGRLPGSYDFHDENGCQRGVAGDDIDQSRPIFWAQQTSGNAGNYARVLRNHYKHFYVVILAANRVDKFKRIVPSAKTAKQAIVDLWAVESAKLTSDQRLALHLHDEGVAYRFREFAGKNILDPAILEAVRLSQIDVKKMLDLRKEFASLVDTDTLNPVSWSNPLKSYPLYAAVTGRYGGSSAAANSEDMILYMNAKYTATKGA